MGRVMECEPLFYWSGEQLSWPSYDAPLTWEGSLTDAQQKASNNLVQAIQEKEREHLIWAVCGAGKTEMLFKGIEYGLKVGKRICIATPRADVVRELKPRIQDAFQEVPIEALYGGSDDRVGESQVILATTHQLLRFYQTFDLMIIDEVDAFPYHHDPTLPFAVNRAKKSTCTTIYLTATPRQNLLLKMAFKQLPHTFVPVRYHGHPLPVPELKMSYSLHKDLKQKKFPKHITNWITNRPKPNRQLLLFVPTILLAEQVVKNLQDITNGRLGVIDSVHADDPDRIEKVDLFRIRKIQVLVTTTILERGVTFPSVDVVVLDAGHSVFDEAALVQIAGRAGRNKKDPTGEVLFIHDGKTNAMVRAIQSIKQMNKRGGFSL
ncbi:DEAD/DEAH box helicase [Ornithinibacillus scapharcae]|uniref:DEAD/DEAH box helicase n=1 Tax=Ornithinibacillus scapharcae TaxID=1147159 RepID=UPI000225B3DD|nr:DEAD/DEAH box helicase family protein [Ornithinibacillus scapharcae]